MKIFFSLLLTLGMASPALAQGKVGFRNDSLHLVYWGPSMGPVAGQPVMLGDLGLQLSIELWAGTSSTALALVATTDFVGQSSPGTWLGMNVALPTAAGLTFFQIAIYATGPPNFYLFISGLFTTVTSGGTPYYSLVNHNSPAFSTWADGTYNMDFLSPGDRGAIMLDTPEPSTFALGCVGFAVWLMRRRADREDR
jgi:hypothetical protein